MNRAHAVADTFIVEEGLNFVTGVTDRAHVTHVLQAVISTHGRITFGDLEGTNLGKDQFSIAGNPKDQLETMPRVQNRALVSGQFYDQFEELICGWPGLTKRFISNGLYIELWVE